MSWQSLTLCVLFPIHHKKRRTSLPLPKFICPALSAIPFILLSEDHDLGKISRKICETAAFHPNIRCICTSSNTAFSLARRGMGATFLPEIYARTTSFPNIHFFTPDHFHDTRDICAVYRKNIYHHAQFQALLALSARSSRQSTGQLSPALIRTLILLFSASYSTFFSASPSAHV